MLTTHLIVFRALLTALSDSKTNIFLDCKTCLFIFYDQVPQFELIYLFIGSLGVLVMITWKKHREKQNTDKYIFLSFLRRLARA